MKNVVFILVTVSTFSLFAAPMQYANKFPTNNIEVIIASMLQSKSMMSSNDLTGNVVLEFTISADKKIVLAQAKSENIYLENHAWQTLNNKPIDVDNTMIGKTFSINLDYIQLK